MANKLKDIFSDDLPKYESTLKFQDNEAYRKFQAALEAVQNDGSAVPVDGVESISLYIQDHGIRFPLDQHTDITYFVIAPATESAPYSVTWPGGEKTYNFKRYRINEGIVLETDKNAVIYLKLVASQEAQKVRITYQIQYQYAKSIGEIEAELLACIYFILQFTRSTTRKEQSEEAGRIREIIRYLRYTKGFITRLSAVEQKLSVKFDPQKLNSLSREDQQEIEDLYVLLCRELPLRLNAKLNSADISGIECSENEDVLTVGKTIALCFDKDVTYDLLGQQFTIYTANVLLNAIIKDFCRDGDKITVYYGDTDSQPIYISYSAYLEEGLAKQAATRNLGAEKAYIEALTGIQYVKSYIEEVELT